MQPRRGRTRKFQSTLPVRGATVPAYPTAHPSAISIHAPRAGSDGPGVRAAGASGISIHAPRAGSDEQGHPAQFCTGAISIHAPRVGSDVSVPSVVALHDISIHAPRVGSDTCWTCSPASTRNFNPRSPCGERRWEVVQGILDSEFQSTLPVWGATGTSLDCLTDGDYFNPRSPCGERLVGLSIRIHTVGFQSTLPVWGATASMHKNILAHL